MYGRAFEGLHSFHRSKYSFIHPLSYTIVFVIGDLISLVIQAVGGGQASAADNLDDANKGAKVMVGGVMFQMGMFSSGIFVCALLILPISQLSWLHTQSYLSSSFTDTRPIDHYVLVKCSYSLGGQTHFELVDSKSRSRRWS